MPWSVSRSGMKDHQLAMFRRIDRLGPEVMLRALDDIGDQTLRVWRAAIQRGTTATGKSLVSLSPAYRRRKEREFPGKGVLERTGELLRSLSYGVTARKKFVYQLELGANGPRAFIVLMQVTGTHRGPAGGGAMARDFTKLPRSWFRALLLAKTDRSDT